MVARWSPDGRPMVDGPAGAGGVGTADFEGGRAVAAARDRAPSAATRSCLDPRRGLGDAAASISKFQPAGGRFGPCGNSRENRPSCRYPKPRPPVAPTLGVPPKRPSPLVIASAPLRAPREARRTGPAPGTLSASALALWPASAGAGPVRSSPLRSPSPRSSHCRRPRRSSARTHRHRRRGLPISSRSGTPRGSSGSGSMGRPAPGPELRRGCGGSSRRQQDQPA